MYSVDLRPASISLPNLKFAYTLPLPYQFITGPGSRNHLKTRSNLSTTSLPGPATPTTSTSGLSTPPSLPSSPRPSSQAVIRSNNGISEVEHSSSSSNPSSRPIYQSHEILAHLLTKLSNASLPEEVDTLAPVFWDVVYIVYFKQQQQQQQNQEQCHDWVHVMRRTAPTMAAAQRQRKRIPSPPQVSNQQAPGPRQLKTLPSSPKPQRSQSPLRIQSNTTTATTISSTPQKPSNNMITLGWTFGILLNRWVRVVPYFEIIFLPSSILTSCRNHNKDVREEMKRRLKIHFETYDFSKDGSSDISRRQVTAVQAGMKLCVFTWDGRKGKVVDLDIGDAEIEARCRGILDLEADADVVDEVLKKVRNSARAW